MDLRPADSTSATAVAVRVHDEIIFDFVLETGLVVDGRRRRETREVSNARLLDAWARPQLSLGTRSCADEDGTVRLLLPLGEPRIQSRAHAVCVERRRREVTIAGDTPLAWRLVRAMDGERTVDEILHRLEPARRVDGAWLLAALVAVDAIDVSGRALGAFLHLATKKGVMPGGGLDETAVLQLLTDAEYRAYRHRPRTQVAANVPPQLASFHALTRRRRSYSHYRGRSIARADFEALLNTAAGITGKLSWHGRRVQLRSYPSSGGLYAIEIYPVTFAVDDLPLAVHHYCPDDHALELLQPADRERFVAASLPEQREMMRGTAAMICLTGVFGRHERKYGQGGYRMLAAEAGHLSQNFILTATALGLHARPCGGVFDELVNELLGIGGGEQFLLSVLVGYAEDEEAR